MLTHWTILLAVEEAVQEGKLFDFDATLPLMAVQFLILVVLLNLLFYKPIGKAIDERDEYISNNLSQAKQKLAQVEAVTKQYEQELAASRKQSQKVIAEAQADAQKISAQKIAEAQQEAQIKREEAAKEIDQQKQTALQSLEQQVDTLSSQIVQKLLGPVLVK